MFGQIVFDDDVLFFLKIGAVRLKNKKLALPELVFAGAVVETSDVVAVISYFESFLEPVGHLD